MTPVEFYFSQIVIISVAVGAALGLSVLNRWFDPSPTIGLMVDLFIWGLAGSAAGGGPFTYRGYLKRQVEVAKVLEDLERTGSSEYAASKH